MKEPPTYGRLPRAVRWSRTAVGIQIERDALIHIPWVPSWKRVQSGSRAHHRPETMGS